jgi:hypothetical protein
MFAKVSYGVLLYIVLTIVAGCDNNSAPTQEPKNYMFIADPIGVCIPTHVGYSDGVHFTNQRVELIAREIEHFSIHL